MKNYFNKLVAVLLLVAATVGVSCSECDHEPYDDTEIKGQIADLYTKLAQLEAKLNSEVSALQAMLNGKAMVVSVTTDAAGNTIVKLSDGKEFTVYAEYKPEALPANLVYVTEVDGVKVWATMGTDGKLTPILDADGKPVPVVTAIPQIQFREKDGMIEISIDGGITWTTTGVTAEKMQEAIANGTKNCALIQSVEEKDGKVIITLNDGQTFEVVKAVESDFGIKSGKLFFVGDESKTLDLVAEGIADISVLDKPEGWKAKINGMKLTITAPAAADLADSNYDGIPDTGVADMEGYVKLLATANDGKSLIGKILVSGSEECMTLATTLSNEIVINNQTQNPFAVGMMPANEFDAEALVAALQAQARSEAPKYKAFTGYKYWNTETTISAKELYQELYEAEMPTQNYVIWMLPMVDKGWNEELMINEFAVEPNSAEEVVYTTYAPFILEVSAEATFNTLTLKVKVEGCKSFITQAIEKQYDQTESMFDYWAQGMPWANLGTEVEAPYTFNGSIAAYYNDGIEVKPNTTYRVMILPLFEGKERSAYTYADVQNFDFTTKALVAGSTETVTMEQTEVSYTDMKVKMTASATAASFYYNIYTEDEAAALDEAAMVADLLATGTPFAAIGNEVASYEKYIGDLKPGEARVVAAVATDAEGKYGALVKQTFKTNTLVYSDTFKVTATKADESDAFAAATKATFNFTTEGGEATTYYYRNLTAAQWASYTNEKIAEELATQSNYNVQSNTTGTVSFQGLATGSTYYLAVLAVGENNLLSKVTVVEYTPTFSGTVIAATDAKWEASKPTVTVNSVETSGYTYKVSYTVTPAAGTKVWGGHYSNYTMNAKSTTEQVIYICTSSAAMTPVNGATEATTIEKNFNVTSNAIFVTWTDAEGNYYEPLKVVAEAPAE